MLQTQPLPNCLYQALSGGDAIERHWSFCSEPGARTSKLGH